VAPRGISIRAFKARWGSCHRDGQLVFNWPIIKAPHSIVDDVVIHELCHLVHANHSKEFWQLVRRQDAAFPAHWEWLKVKAGELM
jgi:predicted metal-dependent hydrolase